MAHSHSGGLAMLDTLAAHSPLREVSPGLKVVFTVAVLFAAIAAGHWAAGLFVFFTMVLAMAVLGGLSLRKIAALLRIRCFFWWWGAPWCWWSGETAASRSQRQAPWPPGHSSFRRWAR